MINSCIAWLHDGLLLLRYLTRSTSWVVCSNIEYYSVLKKKKPYCWYISVQHIYELIIRIWSHVKSTGVDLVVGDLIPATVI